MSHEAHSWHNAQSSLCDNYNETNLTSWGRKTKPVIVELPVIVIFVTVLVDTGSERLAHGVGTLIKVVNCAEFGFMGFYCINEITNTFSEKFPWSSAQSFFRTLISNVLHCWKKDQSSHNSLKAKNKSLTLQRQETHYELKLQTSACERRRAWIAQVSLVW